MISFQKSELVRLRTVGEKLKKRRMMLNLDLKSAAVALKIDEKYLQAIENDNLAMIPGEVYLKNFLKNYANFLNLNYQQLLADYELDKEIYQQIKDNTEKIFDPKISQQLRWYSFITATMVKNIILICLAFISLLFLGIKVNGIVAAPYLIISQPKNNLIIKDNYVTIIGQTEPGSKVVINGQIILVASSGNFQELINLQSGLNIIKISASKKYSKPATVLREILVVH